MDRCEVNRCRAEVAITYVGHGICERHWSQLAGEDAPPDALRMALGIEAAALPAMEESMDDGSKKAKAEAPAKAEAAGKVKKAKALHEPKPAKEPKTRKEAIDNPVVFAFRLSEADRTRIHEAAGPAGATKFVRSAALAAATGDEKAFEALVAQAKSNLK